MNTNLPPLLMIDADNIVALNALVLTRGPEPDGRVASYYLHRPGAEPLVVGGEVAAALRALVTGKLNPIVLNVGDCPLSIDLMASWEGQQRWAAAQQQGVWQETARQLNVNLAPVPALSNATLSRFDDDNIAYDLRAPMPLKAVTMRPLKRVEANPALLGTGVMGDPEYDPPRRPMEEELAFARAALGETEAAVPQTFSSPRVSSPGMPMLLDEAFGE